MSIGIKKSFALIWPSMNLAIAPLGKMPGYRLTSQGRGALRPGPGDQLGLFRPPGDWNGTLAIT